MSNLDTITLQLNELKEDVAEVKKLAQDTNGRLRQLELWRARLEGAKVAVGWIPPLLTAIVGSGVGALVVLIAHP